MFKYSRGPVKLNSTTLHIAAIYFWQKLLFMIVDMANGQQYLARTSPVCMFVCLFCFVLLVYLFVVVVLICRV